MVFPFTWPFDGFPGSSPLVRVTNMRSRRSRRSDGEEALRQLRHRGDGLEPPRDGALMGEMPGGGAKQGERERDAEFKSGED